jgi:hypothetical protein
VSGSDGGGEAENEMNGTRDSDATVAHATGIDLMMHSPGHTSLEDTAGSRRKSIDFVRRGYS